MGMAPSPETACTGFLLADSAYVDLHPVGKDYVSSQRHPACLTQSPSCKDHMKLEPVEAAANTVATVHTELEMVESMTLH